MRSSDATVQQRVEQIVELRLLGATLADVRRFASQQEPPWELSDRQLQRLMQKSNKEIARLTDRNVKHRFNLHVARREALYARAVAMNDFGTAARILRDLGELESLYPVRKIAPTTPDGASPWQPWTQALASLSDEELSVLEKLAERGRQVATTEPGPRN
jgi:hypothetical protein